MSDESQHDDNNNKKETESVSSSARKSLKSGIHQAVESTNNLLASLQQKTDDVSRPLVKGIKTVEEEGSYVANKLSYAYDRRHEFAPYLVLGSALLAGGVVTLRRGKIPGAFSGLLAGGLSYLAVYETVPLEDVPDLIFGKKPED